MLTSLSHVSYYPDVRNNVEELIKHFLFQVLIIAALAIGLYLNTLKNGFVYDDESTIANNTLIKSFDNLPLLFDKTTYFGRAAEMSYRPVVTFTYFIDYALYGLKPWGYHLTNVLLHAINGVLLYIFLTLLLRPPSSRFTSPTFLISLLFVTHPVLTEAVNCVSYREDLLAFLFYMITLILYTILKQRPIGNRPLSSLLFYFLSCLAYILALLSKEMAVTLPLIILCYEKLYGRETANLPSRLFNRYSMGYIAITILYLYVRFYLFYNPEEQIPAWGLVEVFLSLPWLIMNYLKLILIPVHLSADYMIYPMSSPHSTIFILSAIALVSAFTVVLIIRERKILFGALFFLITLMPVYNIVPLSNPLAERYLYLPIVGFVVSTVYIAYLIAERLNIKRAHGNRYTSIFFLIILIILSFTVMKRNAIWRNNYSLWSDTVLKMPNSSWAHNALGNAYLKQDMIELAIKEFFTAVRLTPNDASSHNNLGVAYFKQGRYDEAIKEHLTSIKLRFDNAETHNNLGVAYASQGRYDVAVYELKTAIRLKPDYANAYYNLGNAYDQQGLFDQAIKELLTAIRLKPDNIDTRYSLGIAYLKQGRRDEAIHEFTIVLKWNPDYKNTYLNLKELMERK